MERNIKVKLRYGFVSNSSSTSFILPAANYQDVFQVAERMIPIRHWDNDYELLYQISLARQNGMDPNTPVAFHTCNYDTYMARVEHSLMKQASDECIAITTCNNHQWDFDDRLSLCPTGLIKGSRYEGTSDENMSENIEYSLPYMFDFWWPEFGFMARHPGTPTGRNHVTFCKEHFTDLLLINGEVEPSCPRCYYETHSPEFKVKQSVFRLGDLSRKKNIITYVCCVCGIAVSGEELEITKARMYKCETDHVFCQRHAVRDIQVVDPSHAPESACPVCQFKHTNPAEALQYVLKTLGLTEAQLLKKMQAQAGNYWELIEWLKK